MQSHQKQPPAVIAALVATSRKRKIAQQHLFALPTRLALMRWTRGGDIPHVPAINRDMPMRAAWYGRLQRDFQSWLRAGGFHQQEPVAPEVAIAPPLPHFTPETTATPGDGLQK